MTFSSDKLNLYPRSNILRETLLLVVITLVLATLSWALRPPRLPLQADLAIYELDLGFPVISAAEAVACYDANSHLFIDTRGGGDHTRRVPGAVPIGQDSFDAELREVFDFMDPEEPLLLIGDGNLVMIAVLAERLKDKGYGDITIMEGTLETWAEAGGDTDVTPSEGATP